MIIFVKKIDFKILIVSLVIVTTNDIISLIVECLQNVYHHAENRMYENQTMYNKHKSAVILIGRNKENRLFISTGNFMPQSKCADLKDKIEHLNCMSREEMRRYHLEKLSTAKLSEKGGAGLGMIEIARRSENQLQYAFKKVSDSISFFILSVYMN